MTSKLISLFCIVSPSVTRPVAMLNLGPCSMLPMHYHPRASNYVVAVHGTTRTYMIEENGARVVQQTLSPGQMTIFPQASLHTMYNMGCDNAQLVSALNSEDSGTHNVIAGLFNIPDVDLVNAAFGYFNIDTNATAAGTPPVGRAPTTGFRAVSPSARRPMAELRRTRHMVCHIRALNTHLNFGSVGSVCRISGRTGV